MQDADSSFGANAITQLKLVGGANEITRHTLAQLHLAPVVCLVCLVYIS